MHLRGLLRSIGALLVVAGLLVLAYSVYIYAKTSLALRAAEAEIPGQVTDVAQAAPTVLATFPESSATPTRAVPSPVMTQPAEPGPAAISTEVLRLPKTVQTTESGARATPTGKTVIGPRGLARGKGANPIRLIILRLRLDTRVDEATWAVVNENGTDAPEWQIPFDAVGHLSTTPKPGEAGNAVISGHHNLIGPGQFGLGKFAGLWNLRIGDPVYTFDRVGRIFQYRVAVSYFFKEAGEPLSVREQHAQQILKDDGTPIVTFETCWNGAQAPLSGNTYRWIVVANLVGTVDPSQVPNMGIQDGAESGMRIGK